MKSSLFFTLLFSVIVGAQSNYISGPDLCNRTQADRIGEIGHFIEVPVSYKDPASKSTPLYFWTYLPFDPQKPSMIYFNGGPGGSSHFSQFSLLTDWNVIYLDQRGTACSRPYLEETFFNPEFITSKNIAADADQIRKYLGISKWSIYGHSYGTVPATIYAHDFAAYTTAVVLEGVIDQGDQDLYRAPRRKYLAQNYLDELPSDLKKKVIEFSQTQTKVFISSLIMGFMYDDNPFDLLTEYLQKILNIEKQLHLQNRLSDKNSEDDSKSLLYFSKFNWLNIVCKELSFNHLGSNFEHELIDNQFFYITSQDLLNKRIEECRSIGLTDLSLYKNYDAKDYPLFVPVTYFQGTVDGATVAPKAIHHYKSASKGPTQLFLKINGGHSPISKFTLAVLSEPSTPPPAQELYSQIFRQSLLGQRVLIDDLNKAENYSSQKTKWVGTAKNLKP